MACCDNKAFESGKMGALWWHSTPSLVGSQLGVFKILLCQRIPGEEMNLTKQPAFVPQNSE